MKEIPLSGKAGAGMVMIVDDDDYETMMAHKWFAYYKQKNDRPYACANGKGGDERKHIVAHRLILNPQKGETVDHKNGNRLDNRKTNLRICTRSQNVQNKPYCKNSKTKIKGVVLHECGRYRATINLKSKQIHLGYFKTLKEAALRYNEAAIRHFGEFAWLNKI